MSNQSRTMELGSTQGKVAWANAIHDDNLSVMLVDKTTNDQWEETASAVYDPLTIDQLAQTHHFTHVVIETPTQHITLSTEFGSLAILDKGNTH